MKWSVRSSFHRSSYTDLAVYTSKGYPFVGHGCLKDVNWTSRSIHIHKWGVMRRWLNVFFVRMMFEKMLYISLWLCVWRFLQHKISILLKTLVLRKKLVISCKSLQRKFRNSNMFLYFYRSNFWSNLKILNWFCSLKKYVRY